MTMPSTLHLLDLPLFKRPWNTLGEREKVSVSYDRAREIGRAYALNASDVLHLTPKFWQLHLDNIGARDLAALTLVTIQYNLVAGTLASIVHERPEYQLLLDRILKCDVSGAYLLTEIGHGLDAKHLETTATLLDDGGFDLHTPNANAAKYMPPTSPINGHPRVGIVFAKLMVGGDDYGVRQFIVWMNDGKSMCPGITAKILPRRTGSKPLNHGTTTFNHVKLPRSSLLGTLDEPTNHRDHFLKTIYRITVGTVALTSTMIPMLKRAAFVAGKYSVRRTIIRHAGSPTPIVTFRTQHAPILHTLAQIAVFEAWAPVVVQMFCDDSLERTVQHSVATAFKAILSKATQESLFVLAERCGAQGLYEHNHIIESQLEARGISIAEGDVLTLCIRLATEVLLDRYRLPPPQHPECLLAKHETGLFNECRGLMQEMSGTHREDGFNQAILPRCQLLVESVGHRMAYEAALEAGIPSALLDLYEAGAIRHDSAWYVENLPLSRQAQFGMESRALNILRPELDRMLDDLDVAPYCTAPILSEARMDEFHNSLPTYTSEWGGKQNDVLRANL